MKLFASRNIHATGKVLPLSEFHLFSDIKDQTPNPDKIAEVIRLAEAALAEDIPSLPLSLFREYHKNGNRSNYESLYFKRRSMALWLSIAEGYEKKGRFTEKLADVVWAILEESTWILPAHVYVSPYYRPDGTPPVIGEDMLHGIDLFSAATCALLTAVYYNAKDALDGVSKTICQRLRYMLHERQTKPFLQCKYWWTGELGRKTNNWGPWIISNILFTVALTEEDIYTRELVTERSMMILDNFIDTYEPDGGCDEGPSYWSAAGASLFDSLELLEDISGGRIKVYDSELIRNIGDYIYKVNIDVKRFVNFADCGPTLSPSPAHIVRYGTKCGSEFLVQFGMKQAEYTSFDVPRDMVYRALKNLITPTIISKNCKMPHISYLDNLMVMAARENEDSSKGFFLGAKGGHNAESHNHNDVGNFVVYYDGKPVIIDTGVGTYTKQTFSADRYKLWFMQSGYHNLPSFGGFDQIAGKEWHANFVSFDPASRALSFDLSSAYTADAGIERYLREYRLYEGKVTVTDSFSYSNNAANTETVFHIMSHVKPVITENGRISLAEGRTLLYDKALVASVEAFEPTGMNAKGIWNTDTMYRISFVTQEKSASFEFTVL